MPVAGKSRILIVDDELTLADTLALVFVSFGYEVRVAWSAEQAVETIAEWQPDVAIVDVMLPHMNGIELAMLITENYARCGILLVSGHPGTAELLAEAQRRGRDFEILSKPIHPTFIVDAVSELLAGRGEPADA